MIFLITVPFLWLTNIVYNTYNLQSMFHGRLMLLIRLLIKSKLLVVKFLRSQSKVMCKLSTV